jgi:hypothetical protein
MAFGFPADAEAQQAHDLLQEPVRSMVFGKLGVGRTGDRNELSAGLQHAKGFFKRVLAQTVQDDVVTVEDLFEIVLPVIDDKIGTQLLTRSTFAVPVVVATVAPRCFAS